MLALHLWPPVGDEPLGLEQERARCPSSPRLNCCPDPTLPGAPSSLWGLWTQPCPTGAPWERLQRRGHTQPLDRRLGGAGKQSDRFLWSAPGSLGDSRISLSCRLGRITSGPKSLPAPQKPLAAFGEPQTSSNLSSLLPGQFPSLLSLSVHFRQMGYTTSLTGGCENHVAKAQHSAWHMAAAQCWGPWPFLSVLPSLLWSPQTQARHLQRGGPLGGHCLSGTPLSLQT